MPKLIRSSLSEANFECVVHYFGHGSVGSVVSDICPVGENRFAHAPVFADSVSSAKWS